jgi:xylan 1,4-beta-xylosidase
MTGMERGGAIGMAVFTVSAAMLAAPPIHAQTASTVNVTVDATSAGAPLERVWSYYGYDEANYTITPAGQALLKTLVLAHTAPVYVRTHFLLNTGDGTAALKWGSTNVYTEDTAGNPVYSWTLMDGILDTIAGAGAFPFNEIAFMPQAMTSAPASVPYRNTSTYVLDGGCFYPPKDYSKWGALVRAWANRVKDRYPGAESAWKWELWNEPDIGYWHGTPAEYDRLYDYTEAAVHGVLPTAPVGGPAVASAASPFLTQFLQHCATGINAVTGQPGARLDLISFHAKGGVALTAGHVQMDMGNQLRLHRSGFTAVAAFPAYRQTPIYITEADPDGCAACPVSMTPADAYRNSPAYGAYEVAMMKRTLELEAQIGVKVGGLLTWAFTFPGTPYFAGYRALTTNGINLPVLGAFKLLGSLAGTRIPVTSTGALPLATILNAGVRAQPDVDAMATLDGQRIQVLLWNYHDDLIAAAPAPVHLNIKIPPGLGARLAVTHMRVDETHGDAYTVWLSQGSPAAPSLAQVTALRQAMEPIALGPARVIVDVPAGAVALDFDLPRFGVSLVTLEPAIETVDGSADTSSPADGGADDVGTGADRNGGQVGTGMDVGDAASALDTTPPSDAAQDQSGPPSGSGPDVAVPGKDDPRTPPHQNGGGGCACEVAQNVTTAPGHGLGLIAFAVALSVMVRRGRTARRRLIARRAGRSCRSDML